MDEKQKIPIGTYAHHARHWHYVRRRRTRKVRHTTREILVGQILSVSGAMVAGLMLDLNKVHISALAGAFLVLPGVFDLGGSIGGALSARLNHRLGTGAPARAVLRDSLLHSLMLLIAASVVLGLAGAGIGSLFLDTSFLHLFVVTAIATTAAGSVGLPLVAIGTFLAWKKGLDPDNFIGPVETSFFDTLAVLALAAAIGLVR